MTDYMDRARKGFRKATKEQAESNGRVQGGRGDKPPSVRVAAEPTPCTDDRPVIIVTTEEHEVNEQAAKGLGRDREVFQRGGELVRVVCLADQGGAGIHRPAAPRIEPLPPSIIRDRLSANAVFKTVKETDEGSTEKLIHPQDWCCNAVFNRGSWPGVRRLEAVVNHPVLKPDGTILCEPGYDKDTGLLFDATGPSRQSATGPARRTPRPQ